MADSAGGDVIALPIRVNPCDCGSNRVVKRDDGTSATYHCEPCGVLLADLIPGTCP